MPNTSTPERSFYMGRRTVTDKKLRVSCFTADCDICGKSESCTKRKNGKKVYARDCKDFSCNKPHNDVLCESCRNYKGVRR